MKTHRPTRRPAPTDTRDVVVAALSSDGADELWPNDPTDILSFADLVDRAGRVVRVPLDLDTEWSLDRRRRTREHRPVPLEGWSGTLH